MLTMICFLVLIPWVTFTPFIVSKVAKMSLGIVDFFLSP